MKGRLNRDPAKRKLKRARQRATGSYPDRVHIDPATGQPVSASQAAHASSGKARKKAREGEHKMQQDRERNQEEEKPADEEQ